MYEIFEKGNGVIVFVLDKFRFQGLFSSFFPSPSARRITLDKKIEKARRRERGTGETQSWSRDVEESKKEGRVHGVREKGIEERDEWVGNARNGIPRSQLRSHPDLTRPYSGLIVIAFCLFARRSFLRLRVALFTGALITFLFPPAKNRTSIQIAS